MYIRQFSMICNVDFDLYRAVIQFSYISGKYSLIVRVTSLLKNKISVQTEFNDERIERINSMT